MVTGGWGVHECRSAKLTAEAMLCHGNILTRHSRLGKLRALCGNHPLSLPKSSLQVLRNAAARVIIACAQNATVAQFGRAPYL